MRSPDDGIAIATLADLAQQLLPLDEIACGPGPSGQRRGHGFAADHILEMVVSKIARGARNTALPLMRAALSGYALPLRRAGLTAVETRFGNDLPADVRGWVTAAAAIEPDDQLRADLTALIGRMDTALELVLLAAFPGALAADVRVVAQTLPPDRLPLIRNGCSVWVQGEHLTLPYRLCNPEPASDISAQLSPTQTKILHCLYSRHWNGYVRQRHLNHIIDAADPWIVPFVVKLVGEYVIEIVIDIQQGLPNVVTVDPAQHEAYGRFAATNPEFLHLTSQRVASYWHCYYYRNRYPHDYYPARIVIDELHEAAATHRSTGETGFHYGHQ
ncbi:hypothetical protein AB0C34_26015 [Nocardia sp. NPDC049220]|uniref:hypothetical protein n=1 Tax=Nocardia sp. NPDC049220 TaxID=3155273 RepID=UPI00340D47E8